MVRRILTPIMNSITVYLSRQNNNASKPRVARVNLPHLIPRWHNNSLHLYRIIHIYIYIHTYPSVIQQQVFSRDRYLYNALGLCPVRLSVFSSSPFAPHRVIERIILIAVNNTLVPSIRVLLDHRKQQKPFNTDTLCRARAVYCIIQMIYSRDTALTNAQ